MITIDVQDLQDLMQIDIGRIERWSEIILARLDKKSAELSIVLVDDNYIQQLNQNYLGRNRPTNVISFPQQEGPGPQGRHLGDVVLSVESALHEAEDALMPPIQRVLQLLIHGICHLSGYNHEGVPQVEITRMQKKEEDLFTTLMQDEPATV